MKTWTATDDATIVTLARQGYTDRAIAARLGRTVAAVAVRCTNLRSAGVYVAYAQARFRDAEPVVAKAPSS